MKYIHTRTGAIIDSPSPIFGGNWVKYGEQLKSEKEVVEKVENETVPVVEDTGITKAEIMKELDAMGIEYDKKAKKDELLDLMKGK